MTKQELLKQVNAQIRAVDKQWESLQAKELACGEALSRLCEKRIKILAMPDKIENGPEFLLLHQKRVTL